MCIRDRQQSMDDLFNDSNRGDGQQGNIQEEEDDEEEEEEYEKRQQAHQIMFAAKPTNQYYELDINQETTTTRFQQPEPKGITPIQRFQKMELVQQDSVDLFGDIDDENYDKDQQKDSVSPYKEERRSPPSVGGSKQYSGYQERKVFSRTFQEKVVRAGQTVYHGHVIQGEREGYGKLLRMNGDLIYEGQWSQNMFNGRGVEYNSAEIDQREVRYNDMESIDKKWVKYSGDFKGDMWHGYGIIVFGSGEIFAGWFKEGLLEGEGILYAKSEDVINGYWERSRFICEKSFE
eukprot:TRINITY_DN3778_c0_g1_i1.p2 TRINITY_DN3778_c0_g1~~TRINITY_DN3778_c0_g1_i1.p2  ORF type:complete len:290 (-),score=33.73 TRINITY_DN3778_c0_g1_i1:77-946(-)